MKIRELLYQDQFTKIHIFFIDKSISVLELDAEQRTIKNMKENFTKKIIILIAKKKTSIDECDKKN